MNRIATAVLEFLADGEQYPAAYIAESVAATEDSTPQSVRTQLARMVRDGHLIRPDRGVYQVAAHPQPVPPSSDRPFLAAMLEAALISKGWSAADLARPMKVSRQSAARWVAGTQEPTISRVYELARVLGVPTSHFFPDARTQRAKVIVRQSCTVLLSLDLTQATTLELLP